MEYTVKQISHTLKFGKFLSTRFFVLFFSMFGGLLFVILGALLYCVISRQDMTTIRGLCILILIPVTILIVTAVVFIIQKRRKHIVAHWLTDEDLIVRHVVPYIVSEIGFRVTDPVKIGLKFTYQDRKLTKTSEKHCAGFRNLIEKEVQILYSPKFDQVMILK